MEVHHHPHTPRKKFRHYAFEFLMLFIAIFCGFLADNILEHKIEKNREKQYIKSFIEDLAADTTTLNERIKYCELTIARADSAIFALNHPAVNELASEIYYHLRWLHRSDVFTVNDRTIIQLRNAGGMRLVSNKTVSDSIVSYYKEVDFIRFVYEEQTTFRRSLRPYLPVILKGNDYAKTIDESNYARRPEEPVKLRSVDADAINAAILILANIKGMNLGLKKRIENLKTRAIEIKKVTSDKYHL